MIIELFDHRNAASQLRQTFLQLFLVVVARGFFDLGFDLADAAGDIGFLASTVNDCCILYFNAATLGAAQHIQRHIIKLDAEVFGDHLAAGEGGNVFQHRLAAIAKAWSFHSANLEATAQFVHNQSCKRFAFDVFSDDQQWL